MWVHWFSGIELPVELKTGWLSPVAMSSKSATTRKFVLVLSGSKPRK